MRYNAFAREKAIDALESSGIVDDDGLLRDIVDTVLAAYSAALPIEPTQAPEPPEGKLRVRAAVAVSPGGVWSVAGADDFDDELATLKARPFNTKPATQYSLDRGRRDAMAAAGRGDGAGGGR